MKKFSLLLLLVIGFSSFQADAQTEDRQNAVKLGISGLAFGNYYLKYERAIVKKQAVQIGFGYGTSSLDKETPLVKLILDNYDDGKFQNFDLSNNRFFLDLQYRFYLGKKEGLRGFYAAPYLNYLSSKSDIEVLATVDVDYTDTETNTRIQETKDITYNADKVGIGMFSGGVQLGAQWILGKNKRFVLDWHFLGFGFSSMNVTGSFTATENDSDYYDSIVTDVIEGVNDALPSVLGGGTSNNIFGFSVEDNQVNFSRSFPLTNLRSGLSLGIAF